jgi:serine protease Do
MYPKGGYQMAEEQKEESFVNETIKKKPVNKRKVLRRTVSTAIYAVVFGLVACLTFLLIEPVINNILNPEEISKVEFLEEEEEVSPQDLLTEESVAQQEAAEQEEVMQEAFKAAQQEAAEQEAQSGSSALSNYEKLYEEFHELSLEAEKSIVTVIAISEKEDWFQGTLESENVVSGLIVADNGESLLILADTAALQSGSEYHVRFCDDELVKARLKQKDEQTGLGIFAVQQSDMSASTLDEIEIATLGSSTTGGIVGTPVIAVGSPLGSTDSLAYGMITSNETKLSLTDSIYSVLLTDMNMAENASGVIINLDGEVLGILAQSAEVSYSIAAIGVSDLKTLIAKLSNDEPRAYIGICGMDVTNEAHSELGVPYGAYVSELIPQSPAMTAGVAIGDIITKIGDHTVTSFREYRTIVLSLQPQTAVEMTLMRYDGTEYNEIKITLTTGEAE